MSAAFLLFWRLLVRPLAREPLRTLLTIAAVALGVAVVVAIDLAGDAAAGSFHASLSSLTGKGDLLLTATGGLDERLLGTLSSLPYPLEFSPRIESFATRDGKGEALPFFGFDLIGTPPPGAPLQDSGSNWFEISNPLWAGAALHWSTGEHVNLLINDSFHTFTVAGILPGATNNVLVTDIGIAQKAEGRPGKLDSIEVRLPPGAPIAFWRTMLKENVPASIAIEPAGARTEQNRKMLGAFRWNLRVLSYIALVVGAFLIYNTIAISVVRRRNEIGIVRALGGTRFAILSGFLAEALFFGICGSALGLLLGRLFAIAAVRLIGNTVESLYVSSSPAPIAFSMEAVVAGVALGIVVSFIAALAPALEASRVAPIEALARGREEFKAQTKTRLRFWLALALFGAAAVLSKLPAVDGEPLFAYVAVLLLVVGMAALIPEILRSSVRLTQKTLLRIAGAEAMLAARSLEASLKRASILTAALATAIAMTASVAIMVGSFRQTVAVWMASELKADFYLRPAGSSSADRHPTMSVQIADAIEQLSGVSAVDRFRAYAIFYDGLPATLAGGESGRVRVANSTRFLPGENARDILNKLPTGDYAIVSEPFANKHNVHVGTELRLPLAGSTRTFRVLGIYYDYSTERGYIILDRKTLLRYLPDPAISNLAVYLKPGADPGAVRGAIDRVLHGRPVLVFANNTLRKAALATFDRTFRITYALEAVAIAVAVMGVAGALLAAIFDRRRELALLRFLGGAPAQIRKLILWEAALLALIATAVGLALGTVLSLILIFVINKQSFGWTIQFYWPAALLAFVLAGIYAATVLSALWPAHLALQMNPLETIHEE